MSDRDKKQYAELKADPVKYAAYIQRKRSEAKLRRMTKSGKQYESFRKARWRAQNRELNAKHRKAHYAVEMAVKHGKLIRPECCSKCGSKAPVQGHHESYEESQLLVVEWLCQDCHAEVHHPGTSSNDL